MSGCGRTYCLACGEEMIHRDHRKFYESASAVGQIVWRAGPVRVSVTDIDLVSRKDLRDGTKLLRIIEQKQPDHSLNSPQRQTYELLDHIIQHALHCPESASLRLDERSGVFLIRGLVAGATAGRRECRLLGDQEIVKFATGEKREIQTEEDLFRFIDPQDGERRKQRRDLEETA